MSIQYFGSETFYTAMQTYCEKMKVSSEELATYIATTPDGEEFEFDICDAFLMGTPYPKMLEFVNNGSVAQQDQSNGLLNRRSQVRVLPESPIKGEHQFPLFCINIYMENFTGRDGFIWFTGVVEDRDDPEKLGRVRVRCVGYHTNDTNKIPTADLPWAWVMMPTTTSSMGGLGVKVCRLSLRVVGLSVSGEMH